MQVGMAWFRYASITWKQQRKLQERQGFYTGYTYKETKAKQTP